MNNNRRYNCIAFDAVGTILQPIPAAGVAYYEVACRHGSRLERDEIVRRFSAAFRETEKYDAAAEPSARHITSEAREKERWRQIVAAVIDDIPDGVACFDELFAHFARPESWRCFEDVAAVLEELERSGYRVAVASNFDRRLHAVCDGFAPLRKIDLRIISSEIGWRKPSRAFFEALATRAGCQPSEILMVGDDRDNDFEGARQAGLGAVLINRRPDRAADEIGSLADLVELLP